MTTNPWLLAVIVLVGLILFLLALVFHLFSSMQIDKETIEKYKNESETHQLTIKHLHEELERERKQHEKYIELQKRINTEKEQRGNKSFLESVHFLDK